MKTCAFSGHRKICESKADFVRQALTQEIAQAIMDGFVRFISGFADGSDLLFASLVVDAQKKHPAIMLDAAIPYKDRLSNDDELFIELIGKCNDVHVIQELYTKDCYLKRNTFLVQNSDRLIAVFDGRVRSGTSQTIKIAEKQMKDVRLIRI